MISAEHAGTMARYNTWQNRSLYAAAATLTDGARRLDRGGFWGSIHGTLSHLLWGDRMWMSRFAGWPKPDVPIKQSHTLIAEFDPLAEARIAADRAIEAWAAGLDDAVLAGTLTWFSGAMNREVNGPRWLLVAHMFNHQTHHRGQVHHMLTAAGARPEATDLMLLVPGLS
jgi:uncharacterized damage-inducible protein DinB